MLKDVPWCILGDFNAVCRPSERLGGMQHWSSADRELPNCINSAELEDLHYTGAFYTWSNHQNSAPILRKLGCAMVNVKWLSTFKSTSACFMPPEMSDHSPCVVTLPQTEHKTIIPFKFFEFWTEHPQYLQIVEEV